jgi:RNA polymerase sigma-70 factor, ECF subfamily
MGGPRAAAERHIDIGELYEREAARLWRAVLAYTQDREIASDAVAEAFAQCLRRGAEVRDPGRWVWKAAFQIAAGELLDRSRMRGIEHEQVYELPHEPGRLMGALAELPPRQRAVLLLHHYAGYRAGEIGELLGIGAATVRVHLSRGRRRLRRLLEDE